MNTSVNVLFDENLSLFQFGLFKVSQGADWEASNDTATAEHDRKSEEARTGDLAIGVDEGVGDGVLATAETSDNLESEASAGSRHRESGGTLAGLGLNDFSAGLTNAVVDGAFLGLGDGRSGDLGDDGNDGGVGVAADDGDPTDGEGVASLVDEAGGAHAVEGGDAKELVLVINAELLEDFSSDGNSGVDGVGDDAEDSVRRLLGASANGIEGDGSVELEEIVTSHARLAGNTGNDDENVDILGDALKSGAVGNGRNGTVFELNVDIRIDVRQVSGDTRSASKIVELESGTTRKSLLEEKRKRLTNTTSGTENTDDNHVFFVF